MNAQAVLAKADGIDAIKATVYSDAERAALMPIAAARPPAPIPMDPKSLRTALAGLAYMPMKDSGEFGGKLMLASYQSRLADLPSEAVCHACRVWLDNEKFFPAISDLKRLAREWTSPEQKVINRARLILRCGKRPSVPLPPPDDAERRAFNGQMRRIGGVARMFPGETDAREIQPGEDEPEFNEAEFALAEDLRRD
jgi:hypothetical protein